MSEQLLKQVIDAVTGESITVPFTDEEVTAHEAMQAAHQAQQVIKATVTPIRLVVRLAVKAKPTTTLFQLAIRGTCIVLRNQVVSEEVINR
jgi:hypothetical protein